MEDQLFNMGKRIKSRRMELKIKQNELAEKIGVSNNHMSAIETGVSKPSLDVFLMICNTLRTTPDYLLLGNIHFNNISQNIIDKLQLCDIDDLQIIEQIIEVFVQKNSENWNEGNQF